MRAAADTWESFILDDFTTTLNFGWYPTQPISLTAYHQGLSMGGTPPRQLTGSIVFNSEYESSVPLFMDPSPTQREEFKFSCQEFRTSDDGPIEIQRDFVAIAPAAIDARDLYSIALHEIGHALGLVRWGFFNNETSDGDIDVNIEPYANVTIPMAATHIGIVGPIMSSTARPQGVRRAISQIDVLAVCQVSQFQACNIDLAPTGVPGDFDDNWHVNGEDFLHWQRGGSPNPLSADDLAAWQASYGTTSLSTIRAVPEPSGMLLIVAATGLTGRRLRRLGLTA
jgi:hypothetical protein